MIKNLIFVLAVGTLCFTACTSNNDKDSANVPELAETAASPFAGDAPFSVVITEDKSRPHLPGLHSFVLGTSGEDWIMLAGKRNGMHSFVNYEDDGFPISEFNHMIFVCNATKCDSMPIDNIKASGNFKRAKGPFKNMFKATNLQHAQEGKDLYVTGGYGQGFLGAMDNWETYPYLVKIDLPKLAAAVKAQDVAALNAAMKFGESQVVAATGGELFKFGEDFYLTGGHYFNASINDFLRTKVKKGSPKVAHMQKYLNAIHRFTITEKSDRLEVNLIEKITDGKIDSLTEFRRRDLPVVATLALKDGKLIPSATMYSGVFTSSKNLIPNLGKTANFINPIHIHEAGYEIDKTYEQYDNIYSCPNFSVYDANSKMLYATLMGGIGEGSKLDTSNMKVSNTIYTNQVITINQALDKSVGTTQTIQSEIPSQTVEYIETRMNKDKTGIKYDVTQTVLDSTTHLVRDMLRYGSEANMLFAEGNKVIASEEVFDITNLKPGETMEIGYFYGGIEAMKGNPGGFGPNKSKASDKLFKVSIKMN